MSMVLSNPTRPAANEFSIYIDPQLSAFGKSVAEEEEEVDGREEEIDAIMQNDCTGVASGHLTTKHQLATFIGRFLNHQPTNVFASMDGKVKGSDSESEDEEDFIGANDSPVFVGYAEQRLASTSAGANTGANAVAHVVHLVNDLGFTVQQAACLELRGNQFLSKRCGPLYSRQIMLGAVTRVFQACGRHDLKPPLHHHLMRRLIDPTWNDSELSSLLKQIWNHIMPVHGEGRTNRAMCGQLDRTRWRDLPNSNVLRGLLNQLPTAAVETEGVRRTVDEAVHTLEHHYDCARAQVREGNAATATIRDCGPYDPRFFVVTVNATRAISAGEEITIDYVPQRFDLRRLERVW
jgi:hypothetical protein